MHGTLMVFFVLTNAPFAAFGNYFLPIQIGAEDMAFPRFNMMSFWTTFLAFLVMMASFFVADGPPISGWTAYAPLSAVGGDAGPGLALGQTLWAVSIAIFCIGSLLGALNFIATTLDLRTRACRFGRMPYSTWAWFVTSVIALVGLRGSASCVRSAHTGSRSGNQFLHSWRPDPQRQAAAAFRRFTATVAAFVLVLRPSRGLHRDSSFHRHHCARSSRCLHANLSWAPGR